MSPRFRAHVLGCVSPLWVGAMVVGLAFADSGDFYRVSTPTDSDFAKVVTLGYPTVLSKPHCYVDVIVGVGGEARLRALGLSARLLQKDLEGSFERARTYTGPGAYHRYASMVDLLRNLAARHPDLFKLWSLGPSWETLAGLAHREIWAVEVARAPGAGVDDSRPNVLLTGGIHAREVSTTEVLLGFLKRLAVRAGHDPVIDEVLATRRMFVVPMVNPDGREYVFTTDKWWRKNRHSFGSGPQTGVDLNRNFGFHWGDPTAPGGSAIDPASSTYRGQAPFSEPESRAIRNLVRHHPITASLGFHSYGQYLIYPYGYTESDNADVASYRRLARRLIGDQPYEMGNVHDTVGYSSTGRLDDWLYGDVKDKPASMAMEVELGLSFFPPLDALPGLCDEATRLNLVLARAAGAQVELEGTWARTQGSAGGAQGEARAQAAIADGEPPVDRQSILVTIKNRGLLAARDVAVRVVAPDGVRVFPARRLIGRLPGLLEAGGLDGAMVMRFSIDAGRAGAAARTPAGVLQVEARFTDGVPQVRSMRIGIPAD